MPRAVPWTVPDSLYAPVRVPIPMPTMTREKDREARHPAGCCAPVGHDLSGCHPLKVPGSLFRLCPAAMTRGRGPRRASGVGLPRSPVG